MKYELSGTGKTESAAFRVHWGNWSNAVTRAAVGYLLGKKRK